MKKRVPTEELLENFMKWYFQKDRKPKPSWCKGQSCESINNNCKKCFVKWLNKTYNTNIYK